jgi:phosphoglycerate dehydrogenase-like enzyme
VISRFGSGTDNIDLAAASERGIPVVNVPDFCLSEVADHTMALLLGAARHLTALDRATRSGHWRARVTEGLRRIEGKQLGLVGFGRIAQEVARRARAFSLKIAAHDPHAASEVFAREGALALSFEELLATSDFVSLHIPLNPATRHLMDASQFARMKPGAIFINTARGAVVNEDALVAALQSGHLGGAALDVYEGLNMFGPPVSEVDHPLFHLPNVLLTPHAAACSEEALSELMQSGAQNAIDVLEGRRPQSCVNAEVFDRIAEGALRS